MSDAIYLEWANTLQQSDLAYAYAVHLDATHSLHMALMIAPVPTELGDELSGVHGPWMQVRSAFREAFGAESARHFELLNREDWMRRFGSLVPCDLEGKLFSSQVNFQAQYRAQLDSRVWQTLSNKHNLDSICRVCGMADWHKLDCPIKA